MYALVEGKFYWMWQVAGEAEEKELLFTNEKKVNFVNLNVFEIFMKIEGQNFTPPLQLTNTYFISRSKNLCEFSLTSTIIKHKRM